MCVLRRILGSNGCEALKCETLPHTSACPYCSPVNRTPQQLCTPGRVSGHRASIGTAIARFTIPLADLSYPSISCGAGACAKWTDDYGAVTLGAPRHVDVTADRAYVVVPANYRFKQERKVV